MFKKNLIFFLYLSFLPFNILKASPADQELDLYDDHNFYDHSNDNDNIQDFYNRYGYHLYNYDFYNDDDNLDFYSYNTFYGYDRDEDFYGPHRHHDFYHQNFYDQSFYNFGQDYDHLDFYSHHDFYGHNRDEHLYNPHRHHSFYQDDFYNSYAFDLDYLDEDFYQLEREMNLWNRHDLYHYQHADSDSTYNAYSDLYDLDAHMHQLTERLDASLHDFYHPKIKHNNRISKDQKSKIKTKKSTSKKYIAKNLHEDLYKHSKHPKNSIEHRDFKYNSDKLIRSLKREKIKKIDAWVDLMDHAKRIDLANEYIKQLNNFSKKEKRNFIALLNNILNL